MEREGTSAIYGLIAPHAPTLLEDAAGGRTGSVIQSLRQLGHFLIEEEIDAVIAASTHWLSDDMLVDGSAFHRTIHDYAGFRVQLQYDAPGHPGLASAIVAEARRMSIPAEMVRRGVDHSVTIPLHFLFPECGVPVIPVSVGGSEQEAFQRGRAVAAAIRNSGLRVLVLATGSFSHDLQSFLMWEFDAYHQRFDTLVLDLLKQGRGMETSAIDPTMVNRAMPEGWFRDLYMLLGAIGSHAPAQVMAYDSLPGIGLGVVWFGETGLPEENQSPAFGQ